MLPIAIHSPHKLVETQGLVIIAGVILCLVGVVISGKAGMIKDREKSADESGSGNGGGGATTAVAIKSPAMLIGLIVAVASGVLCACYGVALSFAPALEKVAAARGNSPFAVSFASMSLVLWGGAVSSCGYCAVQLTRNKTWGRLAGDGIGRTLLIAVSMAILHDAAILLFGLGAGKIGGLSISVGYASFMSFAIIVGNIHGFRTGEWKGASPRAIGWIMTGIAVLIGGVCVLAWGNTLK